MIFACSALITVYADSANAAGTKLAPPAPDNIKLPVICKLAFCVTGTPAKLTTGINVVADIALPILGNSVILIVSVVNVALASLSTSTGRGTLGL